MEGIEEEMDEVDKAKLTQACHSVGTAMSMYGMGKGAHALDRGDEARKASLYQTASYKWHILIGISHSTSKLVGSGKFSVPSPCEYSREGEMNSVQHVLSTEKSTKDDSQMNTNPWMQPAPVLDGFDAKAALAKAIGSDRAVFRSYEQQLAMEKVANNSEDIAVVLRTGIGKTAVVIGPCAVETDGVTVWMTMLRALKAEMFQRFSSISLKAVSLCNYEKSSMKDVRVVVVSPEEVPTALYKSTLLSLARRAKLKRIVVDEAHIPILSDQYRSCMPAMERIRPNGVSVPIILLTATAPPSLFVNMVRSFGCDPDTITTIRGNPRRPNLRLSVKILSPKKDNFRLAEIHLGAYLSAQLDQGGDEQQRLIVMCLTVEHAKRFHAKWAGYFHRIRSDTSCALYHGRLKQKCAEEAMNAWSAASRGKRNFVMFATEGFGVGIDAPNVRHVIIVGGSRSLLDFWQVAGRAGRDGAVAWVHVLFSTTLLKMAGALQEKEIIANQDMYGDFQGWAANDTGECRRTAIENYFGGAGNSIRCKDSRGESTCEWCDLCIASGSLTARDSASMNIVPPTQSKPLKFSDVAFATKRSLPTFSRPAKEPRLQATFQVFRAGSDFTENGRSPAFSRREPEEALHVDVEELRRICRKLSGICPSCFVRHKVRGLNLGTYSAEHEMRAGSCARGICLRCMQPGHDSNYCDVLVSPSRERVVCRECFLSKMRGLDIHEGEEFGRKNCPFSILVKLVLFCWGCCPNLRTRLDEHCRKYNFSGSSTKQFATWMCADRCIRGPGIAFCAAWAAAEFRL